MVIRKKCKIKNLVLFLTFGGSLEIWEKNGILDREVRIYEELYKKFGIFTHIISYGNNKDLVIGRKFSFLKVYTNSFRIHPRLYNFLIPVLFFKVFLKVEIIKTNQFFGVHIAKRVSNFFKKPLIIRQGFNFLEHIKEEFGINSKQYKDAALYESKYVDKGDANIYTSERIANQYKKKYKINTKKVFIVPNYVCLDDWQPSYKIKKKTNTIIFFGRLCNQKNIINLIHAVKKLNKKIILIGDGEQKNEIKRLLAKLSVDHILLDRMEQRKIIPFLRKSDVFIIPSLYEGNPKTLIEMMIFKIPVIASYVKGNKEILNEDMAVISKTTESSIQTSIKKFYALPNLKKKKMIENSFLYAKKEFEINKIVQKERQVYSAITTNE